MEIRELGGGVGVFRFRGVVYSAYGTGFHWSFLGLGWVELGHRD